MRFLIEDVTVHKTEQIVAHIRFKGGATQTIMVPLPPPFAHSRFTSPETLAAIDGLLDTFTDAQVAEQLNQQGHRTFEGLLFQSLHVYQLRRDHGLTDRSTRLRARGMLTAEESAHAHGVSAQTIWHWYRHGRIVGVRYNDRGSCLFPLSKRGNNGLLMCFDRDLSDEVHYATCSFANAFGGGRAFQSLNRVRGLSAFSGDICCPIGIIVSIPQSRGASNS